MTIELRPGGRRFVTRDRGIETFHSFSFGHHYDPGNVGFAAMVAHNDENLPAGAGYDDHPHRDVEIVTLVLDGALRHTDSTGYSSVLGPGDVLRTSAGSGIAHAEMSEPGVRSRFLQTWLRPDEPGLPPSYQSGRVPSAGLAEVVGPDGAVQVGTSAARLFVARATGDLTLPEAPLLHVFVIDGELTLGDRSLGPGDAARLVGEGGRDVRIGQRATVTMWAFLSTE